MSGLILEQRWRYMSRFVASTSVHVSVQRSSGRTTIASHKRAIIHHYAPHGASARESLSMTLLGRPWVDRFRTRLRIRCESAPSVSRSCSTAHHTGEDAGGLSKDVSGHVGVDGWAFLVLVSLVAPLWGSASHLTSPPVAASLAAPAFAFAATLVPAAGGSCCGSRGNVPGIDGPAISWRRGAADLGTETKREVEGLPFALKGRLE